MSVRAVESRAAAPGSGEPSGPGTNLVARFMNVRAQTLHLASPLSEEDCCVQSMPDASPVKWHLAHTTWFFETFVLEKFGAGFRPFDPAFRVLFNSYYNGVGNKHPRAQRGLLTRPSLDAVLAYRRHVDERLQGLLEATGPWDELVELGLHHEQQHQELILTDIKHLLSLNPLAPAYGANAGFVRGKCGAAHWHAYDEGVVAIGAGPGFSFDNERPRHPVMLPPYQLASRPVSNADYLAFVESGAYRNPALWLAEGWDWIQANGIAHPLYWQQRDGAMQEYTLSGMRELDLAAPVSHVSYFEADAFARWSDARLPTEAEWENAASTCPLQGHFADSAVFHPRSGETSGLAQMFGDVWEWTSSSYAAYPGYRPAAGAIGEYNGKFMVNQYVLRGGSCATPRHHIRASYRNFFPASARWQFSGIRLARDAA